jgi:hypothetical protein
MSIKAIQRYVSENATASSVITLSQNTTAIEIAAGGSPAVMAWIPTNDTTASVIAIVGATANYDHTIAANTVRRFVIPIESQSNSQGYSSMVGENRAYGLYQRVAFKSQGIASVLLSEYGRSNSY